MEEPEKNGYRQILWKMRRAHFPLSGMKGGTRKVPPFVMDVKRK